jgi:nodulation protein E
MRVVVTGMGAVSALGVGVAPLWAAARDGRTGVAEAALPRPGSNRVKLAAQLKDFNPEAHIERKALAYHDRFSQFAVVAADEALAQAALSTNDKLGARTSVIIGTGAGGITTIDETCYADFVLKERIHPLAVPRFMGSAAASLVGMRYGCTGPTFGVTSACASATQAIGLGAFLIRAGMVDRAIVGGSDSTITALNIRGWELLHVLTPDCPRPFSIGRNGMVLGEGAAILVLESAEAAQARAAEPLAEIAGFGTSSDAHDLLRLDVNGPASAMQLALADAGLSPDAIDYVNAHGTGTIANDVNEAEAMRRVFGDRLRELPVSSTKPIHGHTLGAAGAIELAITIMALREDVAPPTINWLGLDPKIGLDPVSNVARAVPIRAAMSNSFAFGGINGCLIVTKAH